MCFFFFFQAEDGIRDGTVTGVQTCALPICPWPEVLEFVATLPPRSAILDVGCGHGRHAKPAARAGHRVVGVDLCRPLLAIGDDASAEAMPARIEWVVGDATSLPIRGSTFDAALRVAVLHHLPSRADR